MTNLYTTDFKLKKVKMILEEHISKHELERNISRQKDSNRLDT